MITEKDRDAIRKISAKYRLKRVLLFGSSLDSSGESQDIDLAVEGISPRDFFRFYGELMFILSQPVDIVDISERSKFARLIEEEGVPVYEFSRTR